MDIPIKIVERFISFLQNASLGAYQCTSEVRYSEQYYISDERHLAANDFMDGSSSYETDGEDAENWSTSNQKRSKRISTSTSLEHQ